MIGSDALVLGRALWPYLAVAFVSGAAFGWFGVSARPAGGGARAVAVAGGLLLAAGLIVAGLQLVPGRTGLALDMGVLIASAYAAGCGLGHVGRRTVRRPGRAADWS